MKRTAYLGTIFAVLLLAVTLGAYWWWYGVVSRTSAEAAQTQQQLDAASAEGGRATALRNALDALGKDEQNVYGHFVSQDTIVPFLEGIQATGKSLGSEVKVTSVNNVNTKAGEQPLLQMTVRITGSFAAVVRTLGAIEYQPYDTVTTSVTLGSGDASTTPWSADATFLVGTLPSASTTPAKP